MMSAVLLGPAFEVQLVVAGAALQKAITVAGTSVDLHRHRLRELDVG
jgi:hypothetical protein